MTDIAAQAPEVDTPGTPTDPGNGTPADEPNWQERYANLQPEYTRASQEAAQYRSLIEAARQGDAEAIAALGFEIADDETEDDTPFYEDPTAELAARLEKIEAAEQARQQEAQQEALLARAEAHIGSELASIQGLDKEDEAWVIDRALRLPPVNGLPDVQTAHAEFVQWETARQARQEAARQPRRVPPPIVAGGQEGTDAPDWDSMTSSQIDAYMAERARASAE